MASKPKIPRKKNAYEMPKKLNRGMKLVDNFKCEWIVGSSIGKGGFGEIYCVSKTKDKVKAEKDYPYVLKIEPHQNGPLFVEMHFYMRNAKYEDIEAFKISRGLRELGMPHFVGSGSQDLDGLKHRFIVMPRYGQDIWSLYLKNSKSFPKQTIYRLALQMIDVLQYIHKCTYVHGDLKGANMLLKDDSQVYLVDFGLASHYTTNSVYKPDPKKMHNGTIEYTSIDAHYGVPTMRGDMEILGYNLMHWCGKQLPWEKVLNDANKVKLSKEELKSNKKAFMKQSSGNSEIPSCVQNFFNLIYAMKYNEHPNYDKCKDLFLQALSTLGHSNTGPLKFDTLSVDTSNNNNNKEKPTGRKASTRISNKNKNDQASTSKETNANITTDNNGNAARITLKTPSKSKSSNDNSKKVCNLNIDLNISVDTDVVVNIRRKNKNDQTANDNGPVVNTEVNQASQIDDEVIDATPPQVSSRKRKQRTDASDETKAKSLRKNQSVPKASMRAGEYKGKKAKP